MWETERPVTLGNYARPVCLPAESSADVDRYQGVQVHLTGWGKTRRNSKQIDGMLFSVPVRIFSRR